jgi:hypothetical protein
MKTYTVTAPVADYTGEVAGVPLVKGRYHGPLDLAALGYFQGAGYSVIPDEPETPGPDPVVEEKPKSEPLPGAPGRNASKADWKVFWTTDAAPEGLRLTEEQAETLTRDQLAERALGRPKED